MSLLKTVFSIDFILESYFLGLCCQTGQSVSLMKPFPGLQFPVIFGVCIIPVWLAKCAFTPWQELYQKWIKHAILIDVWQTLQSGLCLSGSCKKKMSLVGMDLTENFGSCHMADNSLKKGKSWPFHILHIAEGCDSALPTPCTTNCMQVASHRTPIPQPDTNLQPLHFEKGIEYSGSVIPLG